MLLNILRTEPGVRGSALSFLFLNVAIIVNTYGISVGMENIGWKLCIFYIG